MILSRQDTVSSFDCCCSKKDSVTLLVTRSQRYYRAISKIGTTGSTHIDRRPEALPRDRKKICPLLLWRETHLYVSYLTPLWCEVRWREGKEKQQRGCEYSCAPKSITLWSVTLLAVIPYLRHEHCKACDSCSSSKNLINPLPDTLSSILGISCWQNLFIFSRSSFQQIGGFITRHEMDTLVLPPLLPPSLSLWLANQERKDGLTNQSYYS